MRPSGQSVDRLTRRFSLGGVVAEITAPANRFDEPLDFFLAAYSDADPEQPAAVIVVVDPAPRAGVDVWSLTVDGVRHEDVDGAERAARWAEVLALGRLAQQLSHFAHIHGAVVARDDQSLILIGDSGSGKSTTSVALAHLGFALYTDDIALIERSSLRPLAVPRPIKLDPVARQLLAELGLSILDSACLGESVSRRAVPGLPVGPLGPPVETVIFLIGERQQQPLIRPLTTAEAVLRLVMQSVSERVDKAGVSETARALVERKRCLELTAGDLDATARLLSELNAGRSSGMFADTSPALKPTRS